MSPRGLRRAGFSLVELLVAVAITATVMTAVVMLFTSAMRAMQHGQMAMTGHESARHTIHTLERDMKVAFTSRDFGDYYTFYGTPIGMTFVGVMGEQPGGVTQAVDATQTGLSRVTYVVYTGDMMDGLPGTDFVLYDRGDDEQDALPVFTYTLLRYVEPGVGELNRFRIPLPDGDFRSMEQLTSGDVIEDDGGELVDNLQGLLDDARTEAEFWADQVGMTEELVEEVVAARKRELWIRMLGGDPSLPRFWRDPRIEGDQRPDVRDYAMAERIYVRPIEANTPPWLHQDLGGPLTFEPFFLYGSLDRFGNPALHEYWNGVENAGAHVESIFDNAGTLSFAKRGSPLSPRIPELVQFRMPILERSDGAQLFYERTFESTIRVPTAHTRRSMSDLAGF